MKKIEAASYLPQCALSRLARWFDTPGAFELGEAGGFWMDASYAKWCRNDKRRR